MADSSARHTALSDTASRDRKSGDYRAVIETSELDKHRMNLPNARSARQRKEVLNPVVITQRWLDATDLPNF